MSDSIIRWWPKSQCTMSIASMDEAHAAIAARLAEAQAIGQQLIRDSVVYQNRFAEAEAAAKTWENEAERRSRRYEQAAVRLAFAERIVKSVERVHDEAKIDGKVTLNEGCALFLGPQQYRDRFPDERATDSAPEVAPKP